MNKDFKDNNDHYTKSFGIEWTEFSDTQLTDKHDWDINKSRLELVLGFPLEFLKEKSCIEVGGGAGRFSTYLAENCKKLCVLDASDAIDINSARGKSNATFVRGDFLEEKIRKDHFEKYDLVYCRGVIQHTENPRKAIKSLFDFTGDGGIVIFDVYPRYKSNLWYFFTDWKFFWRKILPRLFTTDEFTRFLKRNSSKVYKFYKFNRSIYSFFPIRILCKFVPIFKVLFFTDLLFDHPGLKSKKNKEDMLSLILVDTIFANYDQPMNMKEISEVLASFGQKYYACDSNRCIVRCKKNSNYTEKQFLITKNGVYLY